MKHYTSPTPRWLVGLLRRVRRIFPRPPLQMGMPFFQVGPAVFPNRVDCFFKSGLPFFFSNL